ncbi:MAG: phage major capsid protein [Actinomycetia bacterium]|nr:phage major capsid protein [Actinomycetes bacterium]
MQEVDAAAEAEGRSTLTAEEREKWERLDSEIREIEPDIDRLERGVALGDVDDIPADIDPTPDDRNDPGPQDDIDRYRSAFEGYLRGGLESLTTEQRQLVASYRAQSVGTDTAGGFTVPEGFWAKVTESMSHFNSVTAVSEVLPTSGGESIPWPTNDDTSNEGAILTENTQVGEEDLVFGAAQLDAYMYTSKMVRVSLQLLQDSGIDVEGYLARKLGERLGRITNRHYTVGTGTGQPQGFVTGATVGVTAAAAAAVAADELIDLEHSVDEAYRSGASWQLNDATVASVRKLKDGDGQYIWKPGIGEGQRSTLLGYEYRTNPYMALLATGAKTIAFGNFRAAYVVRNVSGGSVMRLTERYADFLQVGFLAYGRHDGVVQDASAVKVIQQG